MLTALAASLAALSLTVTTQNVRVGLPAGQARHDIAQASQRSSLVLTQEMQGRQARQLAPPGWGVAQYPGGMRGDCATYWQRASWHLRRTPRLVQLTAAGFHHGHRWALVTVLRPLAGFVKSPDKTGQTVAAVCLHMPPRWVDRRAVYAAGMTRLRQLLTFLEAHWPLVLVAGDWNRPWLLRAPLVGMASWVPPHITGPKGGRPDYLYAHGLRATGVRVIGPTYSDHQGTRYHLTGRG